MTRDAVVVARGSLLLDGTIATDPITPAATENDKAMTIPSYKKSYDVPFCHIPPLVSINCCGGTEGVDRDDDLSQSTISDKSHEQRLNVPIRGSKLDSSSQPSSWRKTWDCFGLKDVESALLDFNKNLCGSTQCFSSMFGETLPPTIDIAAPIANGSSSLTEDKTKCIVQQNNQDPSVASSMVIITHFMELAEPASIDHMAAMFESSSNKGEIVAAYEVTSLATKRGTDETKLKPEIITIALEPLDDCAVKEIRDALLNENKIASETFENEYTSVSDSGTRDMDEEIAVIAQTNEIKDKEIVKESENSGFHGYDESTHYISSCSSDGSLPGDNRLDDGKRTKSDLKEAQCNDASMEGPTSPVRLQNLGSGSFCEVNDAVVVLTEERGIMEVGIPAVTKEQKQEKVTERDVHGYCELVKESLAIPLLEETQPVTERDHGGGYDESVKESLAIPLLFEETQPAIEREQVQVQEQGDDEFVEQSLNISLLDEAQPVSNNTNVELGNETEEPSEQDDHPSTSSYVARGEITEKNNICDRQDDGDADSVTSEELYAEPSKEVVGDNRACMKFNPELYKKEPRLTMPSLFVGGGVMCPKPRSTTNEPTVKMISLFSGVFNPTGTSE